MVVVRRKNPPKQIGGFNLTSISVSPNQKNTENTAHHPKSNLEWLTSENLGSHALDHSPGDFCNDEQTSQSKQRFHLIFLSKKRLNFQWNEVKSEPSIGLEPMTLLYKH